MPSSPDVPTSVRPGGVWLGVDVGTVRVGVAHSDATGLLAFPTITLRRDRRRGSDLDALVALIAQHQAVGVVIGMPTTLAGRRGRSADMARNYGEQLRARIAPVPVRYCDERLSTVTATRILSDQGVRGAPGRAVIDQVAAAQILQTWLDTKSNTKLNSQLDTPADRDWTDAESRRTREQ